MQGHWGKGWHEACCRSASVAYSLLGLQARQEQKQLP